MQHVPPNDARQRGKALDSQVALATATAAAVATPAQLQTVATSARFLIVVSRRKMRRVGERERKQAVAWADRGLARVAEAAAHVEHNLQHTHTHTHVHTHNFNFKAAKTCCKY